MNRNITRKVIIKNFFRNLYRNLFKELKKWIWELDKVVFFSIFFLEFLSSITVLKLSYIMSNRFKTSMDLIFFFKHFVFIFISIILIFIFSRLEWKTARKYAIYIFFIALSLNFVTIIFGQKSNGVRRWIRFGSFSLQSSEFLKALIIIPITQYLMESDHKKVIKLLSISVISCLLQPDLGMTFLIISSSVSLIFLRGENFSHYIKIVLISLCGLFFSGAFLAKYALNRIMIFFGKKEGFQISQSLKALSTSTLFGEKDHIYIPDSHCDFIFAEIVSTFGILIGILIISIPISLFFYVINKTKNYEEGEKYIALGIVNQLCIQSYLHILSNLAFIPTKGLNLPFVSFGGSSLMAHSISIGCLLNILKKKLMLFRNK